MSKTEKEKIVRNYMKSLDLTRSEAEQLFDDDYGDNIIPEVEELTKKAKANIKNYTPTEKSHNKGKKRERVVDNEKLQILELVAEQLKANECSNVEIEKEVNLHFLYGDNSYTIKLTKHRSAKK